MLADKHQIRSSKEQLGWPPARLERGGDSPWRFMQINVIRPTALPFLQGGMSVAGRGRTRRGKKHGYLYPVFWQLCFHGQHLSSIHVRVVGLIEGLFQLLQLVGCEDCPEGSKTL